jgi:hypothetical protein
MDELVAAMGLRKLEQRIDEWGIFTVSLAVREGAQKTSERAGDEASPPGQKVEA